MKILVTGGAGFIGSHIADELIKNKHEVVILDNLTTGNKKNINPKAGFYNVDITSKEIEKIFEKEKFDVVLHQAAQANVRVSIDKPMHDANINVLGSINLLECCRKFNVKKIVYASSGGAIYGLPQYDPCDENHKISPICPYGITKYVVELYLYLYKFLYGIDYCILRYANVYGPRQDPKGEAGVVAIFLDKLLKGEQCIIFGDGDQTRDFVYVEDVARANLLALGKSGIFNIGTGKRTSVNEIFSLLKEINGSGTKIQGDAVKGEVRYISLDTSSAKKNLNWNYTVELKEGLRKTFEWFKNDRGC